MGVYISMDIQQHVGTVWIDQSPGSLQ